MLLESCLLALLSGLAQAQYPSEPVDVEVVTSELNPDVNITYKEVVSESRRRSETRLTWPRSLVKSAKLRQECEPSRAMCTCHKVR